MPRIYALGIGNDKTETAYGREHEGRRAQHIMKLAMEAYRPGMDLGELDDDA